MPLPFWKLQSIGNHFPLVHLDDAEAFGVPLPQLAIDMCDEHFGVGGDGLLALGRIDADRLRLRMFNPDGTEDFCGNGLRCAAHHAYSLGWVADFFKIHHLDRDVQVGRFRDQIATQLGPASFDPAAVPHTTGRELFRSPITLPTGETVIGSALTTGSTHLIIPVESLPDEGTFQRLSPLLENLPLFPMRTSVIWTETVEPKYLRIRIWERGVGETFGCGTGSSAAAAEYMRFHNLSAPISDTIAVENRGGVVSVAAGAWDSELMVCGIALYVFEGIWP